MQNRLIGMQRELNQLWMGLTSSLQGAIKSVRNSINPNGMPSALDAQASSNNNAAVSEIDGKVRDLSKLQRDTDMVYDTLQQQQRDTQQRHTLGDRFRDFMSNLNTDFGPINQLPDRIGQSFNKFGGVVNNLWNQIPERWDHFMQNVRPQQSQREQAEIVARMKSASTTTSTTTTAAPER